MKDFFGMDGPFHKIGGLAADIMILSVLWILTSIPLVTIGASTSALYFVATRRISDREGYITLDYFHSFRRSFKLATSVWLLILLVYTVFALNLANIHIVSDIAWLVIPVQICVFIETTIVMLYVFPIIARFDVKFSQAVKAAFFMGNRHIFTTLICIFLLLCVMFTCYVYPFFVFLSAGCFSFSASLFLMRVFRKYRPEMGKELSELNLGK